MTEEQERAKFRKKRQRARKRKKARKNFLLIISVLVLGIASFLITMKLINPDWQIKSVIPQDKAVQAVSFVKEDILKITTTTTKPTTTKPTTTTRPSNYDYVEFSDFAFDTALQGNQMGNLLNNSAGTVTYNSSYIFYSVAGKGIYRFEPEGESNTRLLVKDYNFKCLNILGDNLYFVNSDTHKLQKTSASGGGITDICDNIDFAYLYNDKLFFVGIDNSVGYINTNDLSRNTIYTDTDGMDIKFIGISLSRVFFSKYDSVRNIYQFVTVDINKNSDVQYFMDDVNGDSIKNLQLECGYFYYYQKQADNTFNLVRQKFGSEKTVTLLESCPLTDYPVIYANRLYYTAKKGNNIQARELNMNSNKDKLMLTMFGTDTSARVGVGYGYQYVFLIGKPSESEARQYRGSCIYTSSSTDNTMYFKDGVWHY